MLRGVLILLISHAASLHCVSPPSAIEGRPGCRSLPLLPLRSAAAHRCGVIRSGFSPAYDTTVRYAAVDWARNMKTLPRSLVLKRIASPLLFFVSITSVLCLFNSLVGLPRYTPLPHTLLGSALGLLLVFRTNAAYDRFWEARKAWSVVTSECRAFASLACTFMTPQQALPMISLIAAFPVCLKNYLRGGSEVAQKRDVRRLRSLLLPEEAACLFSSGVVNQPLYVLARLRTLGQASGAAGVTEKEREIMLKSAATLGDCMSSCERIFNTPIPLAYSRHTSRFLVLYVSTLPLALVHALGWATVPVMAVICWALFGILEIGNVIEEPFSGRVDRRDDNTAQYVLPLTEVCRTIRRDVRAISVYPTIGREFNVPTILKRPKETVVLPEGFSQMRQMAAQAEKEARAKAEADAEAKAKADAEGKAKVEAAKEKAAKYKAKQAAELKARAEAEAISAAVAEEAAATATEAALEAEGAMKMEAAEAAEADDTFVEHPAPPASGSRISGPRMESVDPWFREARAWWRE